MVLASIAAGMRTTVSFRGRFDGALGDGARASTPGSGVKRTRGASERAAPANTLPPWRHVDASGGTVNARRVRNRQLPDTAYCLSICHLFSTSPSFGGWGLSTRRYKPPGFEQGPAPQIHSYNLYVPRPPADTQLQFVWAWPAHR